MTRFISARDFVADGFQKTHYEDPYESMAEKDGELQFTMEASSRESRRQKELAAQTNVDGGIFYPLGMQRYDRSFQSDQRIA